MGRLKKIYSMRLDAVIIYVFFGSMLLLLYGMFGFVKEFFVVYQSVQQIFSIGQLFCAVLIIAVLIMLYLQYRKAGQVAFYQHGLVDKKTGQQFFYTDIIEYEFVPQNNKTARLLTFRTDDNRVGELSALLPRSAFILFQEEHAAVWVPFTIERIKNKELVNFSLQDDTTSFKLLVNPKENDHHIVLSHQGMVVYNQFYPWEVIDRYQLSWNGMLSLKNRENKTIFFEPSTSIGNYYLFLSVVDYFLSQGENKENE